MSQTFAEASSQWATLAAQWLGWRPNEFWRATPAELATALRDPTHSDAPASLSRDQIAQMMERDRHG